MHRGAIQPAVEDEIPVSMPCIRSLIMLVQNKHGGHVGTLRCLTASSFSLWPFPYRTLVAASSQEVLVSLPLNSGPDGA